MFQAKGGRYNFYNCSRCSRTDFTVSIECSCFLCQRDQRHFHCKRHL